MAKVSGSLVEQLQKVKESIRAKLESLLTPREVMEALRDPHARRPPRPCGLTVHTGSGCKFGCVYCYVPDMGFDMRPRSYPLNGLQLVYALASNPYLVPGPEGTLLAFGSVTEPFMEETRERALEYLEAVNRYLGNPTQIATKAYLSSEDASELARRADPRIDVLVTIITMKLAKKLEPGAPSPEERLETIQHLSRLGVHVTLFLRPIIPGVTEHEVPQILRAAKMAGARGVVPGSLRVTWGILRRLRAVGINVEAIMERLPKPPRHPKDQVTVRETELKMLVSKAARAIGLTVYPSSCSANIAAHNLACWACKWGPCGDPERLPRVSEESLRDLLEHFGLKPIDVDIEGPRILVRYQPRGSGREDLQIVKHWVTTLTRRIVEMRVG